LIPIRAKTAMAAWAICSLLASLSTIFGDNIPMSFFMTDQPVNNKPTNLSAFRQVGLLIFPYIDVVNFEIHQII
jgi:hypothetical protein